MRVHSDHLKSKAITFEKAFVRTYEIVQTSLFSPLHAISSYWFFVSVYTTHKKIVLLSYPPSCGRCHAGFCCTAEDQGYCHAPESGLTVGKPERRGGRRD